MFERYTEKARRVIFFARYEASQFGAPAIEPEHLLLGLMREDKTLTGRFFPRAQITIEAIRREIESRTLLRERIPTSVELPLAPETKRVLHYSHEESDRLQHRHIGTEHLLLGLLREERSMAAQILFDRGLRLAAVRDAEQAVRGEHARGVGVGRDLERVVGAELNVVGEAERAADAAEDQAIAAEAALREDRQRAVQLEAAGVQRRRAIRDRDRGVGARGGVLRERGRGRA